MRIAYFDCFCGISGDMTLGAFLDAGLSVKKLSSELAKLKVGGYRLKKSKVLRGSIAGTKFECVADGSAHGHRSLKSINALIDGSSLSGRVKTMAKRIFGVIAAAETKVHGKARAKDVIFHELGDIDSIVDIVGTAIAMEEMSIDAVYSSCVNMGRDIVMTRHGNIPVPSPASIEILKGVPVSITGINAEIVTPTGAGILKALSKSFGPVPSMEISGIGYGAGSKDFSERPNLLRVIIGESKSSFKEDTVYVVETNIDDMNPQHAGYVIEKAMTAGAVDAYIANIQMKKARPAFKLTAITPAGKLRSVADVIFAETSAIGLRFYEVNRMKLDRKVAIVNTNYGKISVKISKGPGGIATVSPEHDECVEAARRRNVPLRKIYDAAKSAARTALLAASFVLFTAACQLSVSCADTIDTNEGQELKGIVVEDYKDRIIMSTVDGEKTIMKSDIKELYYDEEEDNLIKLGDQAKEKRDYIKALTYYDMAFKKNPNSKAAKDGLVFLEGYLFRKEQAQKEEDVRRREDLERQGVTATVQTELDTKQKVTALRKAVGITLAVKDGFPVAESVQPNSPADEAGIERGDRLVAIWARLTGYMSLDEVLGALLDKPSLELKCTIEKTVDVAINPYRLVAPGPNELIGASLAMRFDGLTIDSVRRDGAVVKAGLKAGDLITAIDGKSTRYMPMKKAVSMIRDSKEKTAILTVRREILLWRRD
ncbi:MAG: nickel pincer cofactor biosynthesis protein LarC [Candidatus Omnitrophica bacterium]|nr:nickel pincer cofactor biosynthesis protein LarC [Candidatus Omnitrophota bacterium]